LVITPPALSITPPALSITAPELPLYGAWMNPFCWI
jgi:hypothetical protein